MKKIKHFTKNKFFISLLIACLIILILYVNLNFLIRKTFYKFLRSSHSNSSYVINEPFKEIDYPISTLGMGELEEILIDSHGAHLQSIQKNISDYNIFVIYTKENYHLHLKFELFVRSLLKHTNAKLHIHIFADETSKISSENIIREQMQYFQRHIMYSFYSIKACSKYISDIVTAMKPYFSATPKSYYSDTIFFLSLGLHRLVNPKIKYAILLDCDVVFRSDVRLLFDEFKHFSNDDLFGLAPELTPVYRHILYQYRTYFPKTNFGSPYYANKNKIYNEDGNRNSQKPQPHGYPGLNSGVVLLFLSRIRNSKFYENALKEASVKQLTTKYLFKGHLGDQDFFTLLGYEYPQFIYRLDCIWNRQLCTWWKDNGYSNIFESYFTCKGQVHIYHGNCNTRVPE